MTDSFDIHHESDIDQTGELFVQGRHGAFAGKASAWFHTHEILRFGDQLHTMFPPSQRHDVSLVGGHWKSGVRRRNWSSHSLQTFGRGIVGLARGAKATVSLFDHTT